MHFLARPSDTGKRGRSLHTAVAAAERLGFRTTVLTAPSPSEVANVINSVKFEIRRLVIVGGDGLIHHALPALAGTDIEVGIVPSGSGNDFARGLGIGTELSLPSTKLRQIHRAAIVGATTPIDLLQSSDGRVAASVVTAGFSGRVNARANVMRFPPGQAKYTAATLIEAATLEPVRLRLVTADDDLDLDVAFFAIANTRYFGGGMAICPDALADDGLLDITIVGAVPRAKLLRVMPLAFVGRHTNHPEVTTLRAPWVEIETDEPLWADGEPFGSAPLRLEACSGALLVARPAD